jgi:hypothetical protein
MGAPQMGGMNPMAAMGGQMGNMMGGFGANSGDNSGNNFGGGNNNNDMNNANNFMANQFGGFNPMAMGGFQGGFPMGMGK